MDLAQLSAFLSETQPAAAEALDLGQDSPARRKFLVRLQGEITRRGTIDLLHRMITLEIPAKVAADTAYQNAQKNSDKQNARIEHDKALSRVMTALLKDDTQLYGLFADDESFVAGSPTEFSD